MLIFFGGLIDIPIVVLTWLRSGKLSETRRSNALIALSIPGTVAALFFLSYVNISIVKWRALSTAGIMPFCLQVPADHIGRYRPVTRSSELTGFEMQALFTNGGGSSDYQFAFHAVLVVERDQSTEFYNWSYYTMNFVRVEDKSVRALHLNAVCKPSSDHLANLG